MSAEETTIRVNFGKPMPIFPLDSVSLLPQQVLPLHVFEPRYRQMVEHALDGSGQIAMATFEGQKWKQEYHGRPPVREAVCIGQIVQHEKLPDGRYNILLQGVCRARVVESMPPTGERLYREARLEPIGERNDDEERLTPVRDRLRGMLTDGPLEDLTASSSILEVLSDEEIPTSAVLELVSFTVLTDPEVKYRLLEEGSPLVRAQIVFAELDHLGQMIRQARPQRGGEPPRGCTWN